LFKNEQGLFLSLFPSPFHLFPFLFSFLGEEEEWKKPYFICFFLLFSFFQRRRMREEKRRRNPVIFLFPFPLFCEFFFCFSPIFSSFLGEERKGKRIKKIALRRIKGKC